MGSTWKIDSSFSTEVLRDALERRLAVPLTSSFVVAYSGGCDSHVLLHALSALDVRLRAIYVDHGLQPDSRVWADHCVATCAALKISCEVEHIQVVPRNEESVEAAARRLRYEALARRMTPGDVLLTAHHQDDQAETLLLALMRGTGVQGLAAMPAIAEFPPGRHVRPLLRFARETIVAYARQYALRWVEDKTNRDQKMNRNYLRGAILPRLLERWPATTTLLARAAENCADAAALHDEIARTDLAACVGADIDTLKLSALRELSAPRQRNALRFWVIQNGFRAPSSQHLELIRAQIYEQPQSAQACIDWPGTEVRRYRDELVVRVRTNPLDADMVLSWTLPTEIEIPGIGLQLRVVATTGRGLSQARLAGSALSVRFRRGGEICQLAGHPHHVSLKKLLQESGVPPWERERLPLFFIDEELAAIGGRWICAPFAATPGEPGWQIVVESKSVP